MTEGLDQYLKQLEELKNIVSKQEIIDVVNNGWSIVTEQIRFNAISAFDEKTGLLFDPQTILTNTGRTDTGFIYAEAGVFRSDSEMSARGLTSKSIPAPMYAHWLEFGTTAHHVEKDWRKNKSSGAEHSFSRVKKRGYSEGATDIQTNKKGITATYFISRASDTKTEQANKFIADGLNNLIDKALS